MKTVCAAIIREKGMILVSNRPDSKAAAGKWEFPGGKVEPGESFGVCIIREMQEELALDVFPRRESGEAGPDVFVPLASLPHSTFARMTLGCNTSIPPRLGSVSGAFSRTVCDT